VLPGDDPRTVATLRAYAAELTEDGYAHRFRHDERPLAEAEAALMLECSTRLAGPPGAAPLPFWPVRPG
jgi:hypothetical protein